MQGLVTLVMISLYGVQIRKNNIESCYCKSEQWMKTEYDENVLDYWKLPNGKDIVKMEKKDGRNGNNKRTLPAHLSAFILSKSRRIVNNFIRTKMMDSVLIIHITLMPIRSRLIRKFRMCWIKLNWLERNYVKAKMIIKVAVYSTHCF